jgi:pimeloyl-ACP methyl ester carboxylesterase
VARSDKSSRIRLIAGVIVPAAAAGGVYLAERRAVARWSEADGRYRDEPQTVGGDERWIDTPGGARIRVVEQGDGPPVILAHGFTATADQWGPVAARLRDEGLRVIVYDQRGHGRSSNGNGRFRPGELGDDLAAVIQATAPEGAVVVGHSMGGIGIQAMLADHDALRPSLRGVVLVATLARPVDVPLAKLMGWLGGTPLARRVMANRLHGRILARGGVGREPANLVLDVVRAGWARCADSTRAGVMRDLRDFDFADALSTVDLPVTVVAGDLDQVTPFEENQRIAELLPKGRLVTLTGIGHAAHWEAADRVAEIVVANARGEQS